MCIRDRLSIADNVSVASLDKYLIGGIMLDDGKIEKLVQDNVAKLLSLIHIYYDPTKNPSVVSIDADKAKQWLSNGAQPTDTVRELLKKASVL